MLESQLGLPIGRLKMKTKTIWMVTALFITSLNLLLNGASAAKDDYVTAHTAYGDVRGQVVRCKVGTTNQFLGIPFALPPVGEKRFRPPEPPKTWTGIRDALALASECMQEDFPDFTFVHGLPRTEDCLYLNIYTPDTRSLTGAMPVMVWIHGGGYSFGSGSQYDGSTLAATKGVIVVSINYRLDIFGFMSSELDNFPGNYGLLDQVQALKWVQENIAAFGGDPKQVTIFGESAGSSSVSLLTISPLAKGLFNRAIMESGSSLSPWAIAHPGTRMSPRLISNLIGDIVHCNDRANLPQCLRGVDAGVLLNASTEITATVDSGFIFTPRVESVYGVLPDLPLRLLARGEFNMVDTLRGFNTDEMAAVVQDPDDDGLTEVEMQEIAVGNLRSYAFPDKDKLIYDYVKGYDENVTDPYFIRFKSVEMLSDLYFTAPTVTELNYVSKLSPSNKHYLYKFNYRPSFSKLPSWVNAVHGDDVFFVFDVEQDQWKVNTTAVDRHVSEQVMTMWTNFAKTGDPTSSVPAGAVTWAPYTNDKPEMLKIMASSQLQKFGPPKILHLFSKFLQKIDTATDPSATIIG